MNGRYRWTKNDSITGGASFGLQTPLQGHVNSGNQFDVFDPQVAYNRVGKIGEFQTLASIMYSYGTSSESESIDLTHQFMFSYNAMHAFTSGLSAGLLFQGDYNVYGSSSGSSSNANTFAPGYYGNDVRKQWSVNFYPEIEYSLNDRYAVRTIFGYFNWKHLFTGIRSVTGCCRRLCISRLRIGIAVTRDFYLYPNIQFVPNQLRSDFTNVALSATMNVF